MRQFFYLPEPLVIGQCARNTIQPDRILHRMATNLSHIDVVDITLLFLFCAAASAAAVVVTVATSCMIHLMFLFYSFLLQLNSYIIPILHITFRLCVQHQPEFIE